LSLYSESFYSFSLRPGSACTSRTSTRASTTTSSGSSSRRTARSRARASSRTTQAPGGCENGKEEEKEKRGKIRGQEGRRRRPCFRLLAFPFVLSLFLLLSSKYPSLRGSLFPRRLKCVSRRAGFPELATCCWIREERRRSVPTYSSS